MQTIDTKSDRDHQDTGLSRAITLGVSIGVIAALMAGAIIWLVLTDPVAVAEVLDGGDISPLVMALATALYDALVTLLGYF